VKIRRVNSLGSIDLRDYVQRDRDTGYPLGAAGFIDFTKDNRVRNVTSSQRQANDILYTFNVQATTNGSFFVPRNDRSFVQNAEIAYDCSYTDTPILGLRVPSALRNLIWGSNNFGGTSWTRTGITVNGSAGSPVGDTSATQVTASTSNARLTQARTGTSSTRRFAVYAKSATAASVSVDLTLNNFTNVQSFQVDSTWRPIFVFQTLATPTYGIRIPYSGDSICLWASDAEVGLGSATAMSQVLYNTSTSGSSSLTSSSIDFGFDEFLPTDLERQGLSIYMEVEMLRGQGNNFINVFCETNQNSAGEMYINVNSSEITVTGFDANANDIDYSFIPTTSRVGLTIVYEANVGVRVYVDEQSTDAIDVGVPVSFSIIGDSVAVNRTETYIRKLGYWDRSLGIGDVRDLIYGAAE
jgi:hypothetical protein